MRARVGVTTMHHAGGAPYDPRAACWALCGRRVLAEHATNDEAWVDCLDCLARLYSHDVTATVTGRPEDAA